MMLIQSYLQMFRGCVPQLAVTKPNQSIPTNTKPNKTAEVRLPEKDVNPESSSNVSRMCPSTSCNQTSSP